MLPTAVRIINCGLETARTMPWETWVQQECGRSTHNHPTPTSPLPCLWVAHRFCYKRRCLLRLHSSRCLWLGLRRLGMQTTPRCSATRACQTRCLTPLRKLAVVVSTLGLQRPGRCAMPYASLTASQPRTYAPFISHVEYIYLSLESHA